MRTCTECANLTRSVSGAQRVPHGVYLCPKHAAADEMLEALRALTDAVRVILDIGEPPKWSAQYRDLTDALIASNAAIARAEGEG